MPVTTRLAVASSRAFGEFTSSLTLTTVTFTANGTWTAPGNVAVVTTLYGVGQAGVSDSTTTSTTYGAFSVERIVAASGGSTHDWSELRALYDNFASTYNSGSGVVSSFSYPLSNGGRVGTDDTFSSGNWTTSGTGSGTNLVRGSVAIYYNNAPTSGTITYADVNTIKTNTGQYPLLQYNWTVYVYGSAGGDSTALGYTFAGGAYSGGTGYPATPATYNNVSVTPGASYSVVVPSGGQVQISYYT